MDSFIDFIYNRFDTILAESFKPHETLYGTNYPLYDNGEVIQLDDEGIQLITYFADDEIDVKVVIIEKNGTFILKFGVSRKGKNIFSYDIYHDVSFALDIFSRVMYLCFLLVDRYDIPNIVFSSGNNNVKRLYPKLVVNKLFTKYVNENGFEYDETSSKDDYYVFRRI